MNIFQLLAAEFSKLFANKAILASIVGALLVPVVYGGILLSATWGPYDNLSNLPVAVVNEDVGATSDDRPIHVGNDLVENLTEGKSLGWDVTSSTEAMKGLQTNDYYMVIVIPKDFSQRVTSVMDDNPQKPKLEYIQNEGLNFLASQVTKSATEKIREQLANTITEQYTATALNGMGEMANGFQKAADGSQQLSDGSTKLKDGTSQLHQSVSEKSGDITKLANGAKELKGGTGQLASTLSAKQSDITKLANGTQKLKDGTATLLKRLQQKEGDIARLSDGSKELHEGTVRLQDGTGQLLDGLQQAEAGGANLKNGLVNELAPGGKKVADGVGAIENGASELYAGSKELVQGLEDYKKANPTVNVGPYYQQIIDGAKKISNGLEKLSSKSGQLKTGADKIAGGLSKAGTGSANLHSGLQKLLAGQQQVHTGAGKLEDGAGQLSAGNAEVNKGWQELIKGVTALDNGAGQIRDGNEAVDTGWQALTTGAKKIDNGMLKVSNGTSSVEEGWGTLEEGTGKLNDGAGKLNDGTSQLANGLKDGADKSAGISSNDENVQMFSSPVELAGETVNNYEHYRDSTAPYILSLGLFVGILIMSMFISFKKPEEISGFSWFTVKFLHLATLAIAQALLLIMVVFFLLNLHISNPLGFIIFTLFTSVVFASIVLFLSAFAGNVGRLVALVFVVLQLSITGANLPIEMLPPEYRSLSAFLPFTYSIAGFKSVITLGDWSGAMKNISVLFIFLVVFSGLSLLVFIIKNRKRKHQQEDVSTYA
ncbi:Chromosome partition protein Smc [Bacillus sp. THAF10]|uniref:YhgE/Pip domain-containing protein n=1 Tax=Bacillus sp. THAF10 TaxID=2587848 RepID=UPI0012AA8340|nr:YhgE/Pip domain-containing protein [Bacillus sp. THAF10]QFT89058.1 Chromosome partition protein Smc [Bacillus sp. THAF10]